MCSPTSMPACRNCGAERDRSANFCARCGAPQNEAAYQKLEGYVERRVQERLEEKHDDRNDDLELRISYALGFVGVVAGLALSGIGGGLIVLGGLLVLPPVRRLASRPLGRPLGLKPALAAFAAFIAAGLLAMYVA